MRQIVAMAFSLLPSLVLAQGTEKGLAPAAGSVAQRIEKLDDELISNIKNPNAAFFERLLADDYIAIRADGNVSTKQQTIDMLKSGKLKYDSIEAKSRNVRVYGDAAILTLEADMKGHAGPRDFSGTFRSTRVYVKAKNDEWVLVTFQITKEQ